MTYNVISYPTATADAEAKVVYDDDSYHRALEVVADFGDHFEQLIPLGSVPFALAPYGVKQAWELRDKKGSKIALLAIQEVRD